MTTRTREKRRRRKALARWWRCRLDAIFADFEKQVAAAQEEMRALSIDAFIFGRMVVEHGPARTVRRVPPSEWADTRLTFDVLDDEVARIVEGEDQ